MSIIKTIPISEIKIVPDFNVRADCLIQSKIAEYVETFEQLPPVSVFDVDGVFYLVDGWHRMEAAKKLELTKIDVTLVGVGSMTEAEDWADKANLQHGIPLTPEQRRAVAVRFANRHPDWSFKHIAEIIGCSDMSVKRWIDTSATNVAVDTQSETAEKSAGGKASQTDRAGAVDIKAVTIKFKEWWNRTRSQNPITKWSPEMKRRVKSELEPIVQIYNQL